MLSVWSRKIQNRVLAESLLEISVSREENERVGNQIGSGDCVECQRMDCLTVSRAMEKD